MTMATLRVLSFNLWKNEGRFQERMQLLADGLPGLRADILALQECFVAPALDIDVAASLASICNSQLARGEQRRKLRLHDGDLQDSRSDLAILTRLPVESTTMTALPGDPRDGERNLLMTMLRNGESLLCIGCTHLTHLADGDSVRRQQAEAVVEALLADDTRTSLLMGDLNAPATSPALAGLIDHPRLQPDCREQALAVADHGRTGGAIDHVLLFPARGERWQVTRQLVLPPNASDPDAGPSDHPAILSELERLT